MIFIGLDWARSKHDFTAIDTEGNVLTRGTVPHDAQGLMELGAIIASLESTPQEVHVGVELHNGALLSWLLGQNYIVYSINPKSADRARDRHRPSGAKDDKLDAFVLADMARTDRNRLRPIRKDSAATRELRAWTRLRGRLVQQKTATSQRLRALLAEWAPRLSTLCDDFNRKWQRDLLELTPLHGHLKSLHGNRINAFCHAHRLRSETVSRIRDTRKHPALVIPAGLHDAICAEILGLVESLNSLIARIDQAETEIDSCIQNHPDAEIFQSLPVKGTATVGTLLAAFGESREDTPHWRDLAACWGVAPVTVQSGKSRHVKRRRACDHTVNQALLFFSFKTAFTEGCWAQGYYQKKRDQGCDHYGTLRCLAQRWVKIIHRLWRDRILYSEQLHQRNLQVRGAVAA